MLNAYMPKSLIHILYFALLFIGFAVLAWFNHPFEKYYTWLGLVWADVSGYFIYLPATFYYNWDATLVPPESFEKLGQGFFLEADGIIRTKYTYGVSLLLSPFYLITDIWWRTGTDIHAMPGLSIAHQRAVLFGGVFWAAAGCYWLSLWLQKFVSQGVAILWVTVLFLGSNLLFFTIESMGMSHIYSFSLFAALFLLTQRLAEKRQNSSIHPAWWGLFGVLIGLLVVIRPTNLLFLFPLWWLHREEVKATLHKMQRSELIAALCIATLGGLTIIFPQLLYWKYAYGNWVHYSYAGEVFYWTKPALALFWFAVSGGMWWYIPVLWIALPAWIIWYRKSPKEAAVLFACYVFVSYVNSCWWLWNFGGGYGARAMAEYNLLLALPLVKGYPNFWPSLTKYKNAAWAVTLSFILFYSFKLTYSFKRYYGGAGDWDWSYLFKLIFK